MDRFVIINNIYMGYLSCMGLELLHVNGKSISTNLCITFELISGCPGFRIFVCVCVCVCVGRAEPRLCDRAIWMERTSDFTLFFLHRLNKCISTTLLLSLSLERFDFHVVYVSSFQGYM